MEFWVVAAATGAGYVAKHWHNLSGEKQSPPSNISSPHVHPETCQLLGKLPSSGFVLPKRCQLSEGEVSSFEEEQNKVGMNLQERHECINSYGNPLLEFRTKNLKRKSFSRLRHLMVNKHSRQMTQIDDVKDDKMMFIVENGASIEETELLEPGSVKLPRRPQHISVNKFETRELRSQDDMVSIFLGITIGILSTIVTNRHEINHLNELLEQAENMVQDLHKKLESKDGFTTHKIETEPNGTEADSPNVDNVGLMSDIEAELEAELERLQENIMMGDTLHRLSNAVEIDSDLEADMAREDLNLDVLTWQLDSQSESDQVDHRVKCESTGKPIYSPNYTVSSLDLRLRLHEVIESELRARIDELEAVMENRYSQSRPHSLEQQDNNSFWDFDHTRIESFSSTP